MGSPFPQVTENLGIQFDRLIPQKVCYINNLQTSYSKDGLSSSKGFRKLCGTKKVTSAKQNALRKMDFDLICVFLHKYFL